jgi:uncharacterized protein
LYQAGRIAEAEDRWRRSAERGHPGAAHNLHVLLTEQGRHGEAARWST